jgi:hypothetical protein
VLIASASAVVMTSARVASAQDGETISNVDISFDVGDFDETAGDWTIDVVEVSGDLRDGQEFTVELTDSDGAVVWSATDAFVAPVTRISVSELVTVGEVAAAGVSQAQAPVVVEGVQIEPPRVDFGASGSGGGGQLALSMVMAVLLVAIVFRTPLPSASTQRWTK